MLHTGVGAGDTYQLAGYFKENAAFVIPVIIRYLEMRIAVKCGVPATVAYWNEALSYIEGQTEVMDWDSRDSNGWQTVLRFKESPMKWVTYNYAVRQLGMKHVDVLALETVTIHAPNNIKWKAFKVETEKETGGLRDSGNAPG